MLCHNGYFAVVLPLSILLITAKQRICCDFYSLQMFYSLKTKIKQKTFDCLSTKSVWCMCASRQFYFQNAVIVDTAYLQNLSRARFTG